MISYANSMENIKKQAGQLKYAAELIENMIDRRPTKGMPEESETVDSFLQLRSIERNMDRLVDYIAQDIEGLQKAMNSMEKYREASKRRQEKVSIEEELEYLGTAYMTLAELFQAGSKLSCRLDVICGGKSNYTTMDITSLSVNIIKFLRKAERLNVGGVSSTCMCGRRSMDEVRIIVNNTLRAIREHLDAVEAAYKQAAEKLYM